MDILLLYHFRILKGVAIEILQELVDDITTNLTFEIVAIKLLAEIEKYLAIATLCIQYSTIAVVFRKLVKIFVFSIL